MYRQPIHSLLWLDEDLEGLCAGFVDPDCCNSEDYSAS